ncbi:MAG: phage antirepressor KilAC domain-containing protein [Bacteroides sp.]|nr:phage antirepressor KilAC domain-containing protein [Eubacterium sp.]MCM1417633.1 phage antirepressor KilAC domain-containing protein [Roseburia sp.]MCM1461902.1 phage antirepressor KilAC domain-containing protein [Bacteroides sp.]
MTNQLQVLGTQDFMGIEIPIIEGGFGENQRVILAKTIAEIHDVRLNDVQELINQNLPEFEYGIDILDLCDDNLKTDAVGLGLISSNRQKHCYLLSEQGYMALAQLMRTERAKEIRKQLRREYFAMRKELNGISQKKSSLLLSIYDGGVNAITSARQLVDMEVETATTPLFAKIEEDRPYTEFAKHVTESSDTVDVGEFAKIVKNEHIDIGRNRLFAWLREKKYLMDNNTPYQKYLDQKYFEVIETKKETAYGTKIFTKLLITGKGQVALVERLRKELVAA